MLLLLTLGMGGAAGCGRSSEAEEPTDAFREQISGSLQIVGSSSMEKLTRILAEGFMENYPEVTVTVQFTGSGAGIEALAAGSADIGNASRYLKEEEKVRGAVENIVGLDGIAVCVDSSNRVNHLTKEQLQGIYGGRIRDWSELGGDQMPIVVIGREAGSGTRNAFEKLLGLEEQCVYGNELDSTGAVAPRVASTPGAIGYISFDVAEHTSFRTLKTLTLDGTEPTVENICSGSYALYRPFVMATQGEISGQDRLVQIWFDYVYGEEGQRAAQMAGIVPAAREREYEP